MNEHEQLRQALLAINLGDISYYEEDVSGIFDEVPGDKTIVHLYTGEVFFVVMNISKLHKERVGFLQKNSTIYKAN